nr:MAG TPA: hypothetical protein [Caudoviricetes sp.]
MKKNSIFNCSKYWSGKFSMKEKMQIDVLSIEHGEKIILILLFVFKMHHICCTKEIKR